VHRAAAVAVAPLVALALPAQAAPTAGPEEAAEVALSLVTSAGRHELSLLVTRPAGAPAQLRVHLRPADGGAPTRLAGALPAGALTTDGGVLTLRAEVGDVPVTVTWREREGAFGVSGGYHEMRGVQQASGWVLAGSAGDGEVSLGDTRCGAPAFAGVGRAVVYETGQVAQPLGAGLGLPLRGLRCFGEWSEVPPA